MNRYNRFPVGTSQTGSQGSVNAVGARFRRGAGRISLDFVRTLKHRGTPWAVEELIDPAALNDWVDQCGPFDQPVIDADTAHAAMARALREAVHEMICVARTPAGPRACSDGARRVINEMAARAVPAPSMDATARLRWNADEPVLATLAMVARDALDLVTSPLIGRVRGCANPECGALFLDSSRPGQRRWCSMSTCGNLAKKSALRLRSAH